MHVLVYNLSSIMVECVQFMKMIEEIIKTPIKYECDVAVAGGGIAGIAAALAAARRGASVILLERSFVLGGLATSGLVTIYLPLCDGEGEQVSFGIAEELLKLSVLHGTEGKYPPPMCWLGDGTKEERRMERYKLTFNPWLFAIDAEKLLLSEGAHILYGATAVAVGMENGKISHLIIEGKGGREAIKVKNCVIDCTGDADIAYMAGAPTAEFSYGNKLAAWYYFRDGEHGGDLTMLGICDDLSEKEKLLTKKRYRALGTDELSDMTIDSHTSTLNDILKKRAGGAEIFPTAIATTPQVRMTRRIVGEYTMDDSEIRKHFPDSVGAFSDWRKSGPAYELPFRALYSGKVKNLLAAGRCISVTDDMWDITRVIPVCAVSGEAAGAAAAVTDDITTLDIKDLQRHLIANGVKITI